MLELKNALDKTKSSKEFKDWQKSHPNSYLTSFFKIIENSSNQDWQLDFYYPEKNTITSFISTPEIKILEKDSKIFQKEKTAIEELKLEQVKINLKSALNTIETLRKNKYPNEKPNKIIIVLQNIETPLWNITYLTSTLNILHIKINAQSGKIIEEKLDSILNFKTKS